MPRNRHGRPKASRGTAQQQAARKGMKPAAAIRLDWDTDHPWWLTLDQARLLRDELHAAIREVEREEIAARNGSPRPAA